MAFAHESVLESVGAKAYRYRARNAGGPLAPGPLCFGVADGISHWHRFLALAKLYNR